MTGYKSMVLLVCSWLVCVTRLVERSIVDPLRHIMLYSSIHCAQLYVLGHALNQWLFVGLLYRSSLMTSLALTALTGSLVLLYQSFVEIISISGSASLWLSEQKHSTIPDAHCCKCQTS